MNHLVAWIADVAERASLRVAELRHYHVVWLALYFEWTRLECHDEARLAAQNVAAYRQEIDLRLPRARFWLTLAQRLQPGAKPARRRLPC